MLDFSFGEILVIAIIAVIFLGPDKLPQTFVKIAKFLRAVKKTINDAKDTLDREIHITEMKQDALEYKKKFEDSALKLKDDIIESANLEPTKTALQNELEGLKNEIKSLKVADKLNEPLEKSSISLDEVESKGKALQNRLKRNLKPTKNTKDSNNLGESKGESAESKKTKKAKVAKDSSKSSDLRKSAESTKSTTKSKAKKATAKDSKDSKISAPKKAKNAKDSSKSAPKKRESKAISKRVSKTESKKSKKSKNANSK